MNSNMPDDWTVPTFREISLPIDTFGVPPEHFALAIMLGATPSLLLLFASTFGKSLTAFFCAVGMAVALIPAVLFLLRSLYKSDNYWFEHIISHRYPSERYIGR